RRRARRSRARRRASPASARRWVGRSSSRPCGTTRRGRVPRRRRWSIVRSRQQTVGAAGDKTAIIGGELRKHRSDGVRAPGAAPGAGRRAPPGVGGVGHTAAMTHTTGWDAAVGVDWSKLCHAYGAAHDTPAHLRALTDGDADAVRRALKHLCSAVVHQGTPWPVTAPAARVVAGLLAEESLSRPAAAPVGAAGEAGAPLRSALLSFLAGVAEAGCPHLDDAELRAAAFPAGVAPERVDAAPEAVLDGDATEWPDASGAVEALTARAVLDLRAAAPALLDAVVPHLADGEPLTRMHAAHAAAALAVLVGDAARREDLADRVAAAARRAVRRDERACLVLAL